MCLCCSGLASEAEEAAAEGQGYSAAEFERFLAWSLPNLLLSLPAYSQLLTMRYYHDSRHYAASSEVCWQVKDTLILSPSYQPRLSLLSVQRKISECVSLLLCIDNSSRALKTLLHNQSPTRAIKTACSISLQCCSYCTFLNTHVTVRCSFVADADDLFKSCRFS